MPSKVTVGRITGGFNPKTESAPVVFVEPPAPTVTVYDPAAAAKVASAAPPPPVSSPMVLFL